MSYFSLSDSFVFDLIKLFYESHLKKFVLIENCGVDKFWVRLFSWLV